MLLTLSKPTKTEFEFKTPHDYSPPLHFSDSARFSPKLSGGSLSSVPSLQASGCSTMGTPHRGLPPPAAMTLPDPSRGPPPIPQPMGQLPPAPPQWQGAEEGMKNWLMAKAEEDRRKQEEEKTRQETLKLEQRKIEQAMLRESMQGGIPPHLVPSIFTGIGGANTANTSIEWLQQYVAQLQASVQQQQHQQSQSQSLTQTPVSPELRRETRLIGSTQPSVYGAAPQTPQQVLPPASVLPGQPLAAQPQHAAFSTSYGSGGMSPRARAAQTSGHVGAPTSAPRPPPQSQLPRLTTNEIHIQQPPVAPSNVQQLQQSQSAQQEQSSPSIYFHHWVPPTSSQEKSSSGNPPATPSGKDKASSAFSSRPRTSSHASDPDYASSPKKRKAQGGHQAAPPPSTTHQYHSPSFSHISSSSASTPARRGHARTRSDLSTRGGDSHGGGAVSSRRGTISGPGQTESSNLQQQLDTSGGREERFPPPPREGSVQQQQQQQQHPLQQQLYHTGEAHQQRNEGLDSGQHRTGTPLAIQAETRQSQPQHQMAGRERGSVPSSPKRGVGGQ